MCVQLCKNKLLATGHWGLLGREMNAACLANGEIIRARSRQEEARSKQEEARSRQEEVRSKQEEARSRQEEVRSRQETLRCFYLRS